MIGGYVEDAHLLMHNSEFKKHTGFTRSVLQSLLQFDDCLDHISCYAGLARLAEELGGLWVLDLWLGEWARMMRRQQIGLRCRLIRHWIGGRSARGSDIDWVGIAVDWRGNLDSNLTNHLFFNDLPSGDLFKAHRQSHASHHQLGHSHHSKQTESHGKCRMT